MEISTYWELFKDYLPILGLLIALTTAVIFAHLIPATQKIADHNFTSRLKNALELQNILESNGYLTLNDKDEFDEIVSKLKNKAKQEQIEFANRPDDYTDRKIEQNYYFSIGLAMIFLVVDVAIYSLFIDSLEKQNIWGFVLVFSAGIVIFLATKFRKYAHLQ